MKHHRRMAGIGLAFLFSLGTLASAGPDQKWTVMSWLTATNFQVPIEIRVDGLSSMMLAMVTFVSLLVAIFAVGYMAGDPGYAALRQLPGIGPVLAAIIIAEIGDVTRFKTAAHLSSWAGLTPKHRESDTSLTRGHVTKQGSRLLRWALIEAIQRARAGSWPGDVKDAIVARRGKQARNIAKVAAARRLLTLVYYGLRDGEVRCLASPARG